MQMPIPCVKGLTSKLPGVDVIDGLFSTWVKKNSVIGEELCKTFNYKRVYKSLDSHLGTFSMKIYAYDGECNTEWLRDGSGNLLPNFHHVCTLTADMSDLQRSLKVQKGPEGQDFWKVDFNVNVRFGGTALKAKMTWHEGVSSSHFHPQGADSFGCAFQEILREGPVGIIPNSIY